MTKEERNAILEKAKEDFRKRHLNCPLCSSRDYPNAAWNCPEFVKLIQDTRAKLGMAPDKRLCPTLQN
jgi:hypothetical protein